MKFSILLLTAVSSLVLASDDRDLSGDVWATAPAISKRQTTWSPPSALVKPLEEVWAHEVATYGGGGQGLFNFKNYGYDIIHAAQGYVVFSRWMCRF